MRRASNPQPVIVKLNRLGARLSALGSRHPVVLTGTSFASTRAANSVRWSDLGCLRAIEVPAGLPTVELLDLVRARVAEERPDGLVAIGGGRVIDAAKCVGRSIALGSTSMRDTVSSRRLRSGSCLPLAAIPTTAGSGSERTPFAVTYVDDLKVSLEHPSMKPRAVTLIPEFTETLSPANTAISGADAFCQAIEAIWSKKSTPACRRLGQAAAVLLHRALPVATAKPTRQSRAMALAGATLAGRAIATARTTAPHALSYVLTSRFMVPHGQAVALFMPAVARHNLKLGTRRQEDCLARAALVQLAGKLGMDFNRLDAELVAFFKRLNLASSLRELGIDSDELIRVYESGAIDSVRLANNPVQLGAREIRAIVRAVE